MPHIATGDMLREHLREGTALGLRGEGVHGAAATLVPDAIVDRHARATACRSPTPRPASCSTASRATLAQAQALDEMLAPTAARIDGVLGARGGAEDAGRAAQPAGLVCREARHVYHVPLQPARRSRASATSTAPSCTGATTTARTSCASRYRSCTGAQTAPVLDYYDGRGLASRIDAVARARAGRRRVDQVDRGPGGGGGVIVRKSAAEIEKHGRRRGAWSPRRSRCWPRTARARRDDGRARRHRRAAHPRRGGVPTFKGYRGFPGSICASPNDMIVHGIPGPYALADGDMLSLDVGVTLRGFVADSAVTVPVGDVRREAAAAARGLPSCRSEPRSRQCRPATGWATSGTPCRSRVEGAGLRRRPRRSSATASAGAMHEDPQIPNYGPPGRGPELSRRAWCSRSSR